MTTQKLQFFGFCAIFTAIITFCVLAGGYTSFWRSENRIKGSTDYLTDACQTRLNLLPKLIERIKKNNLQIPLSTLESSAREAEKVLQHVIAAKAPLEEILIKEFEITQSKLTSQLKEIFFQLETSQDKTTAAQFSDIKKLLFDAQNNLFVSGKRYNDEVTYFNTRKKSLMTSTIAKLFGFNKSNYFELSKDLFLPAEVTFAPKNHDS